MMTSSEAEPTTSPEERRGWGGRRGSAFITLGFMALGAVLVTVGAWIMGAHAENVLAPEAAKPMSVSVTPLTMLDGYEVERRFMGRIEASRTADLSFDVPGQVLKVLVDEGDRVAEGDTLAILDTRLLDAEAAQLDAHRQSIEARLAYAEKALKRSNALSDQGFNSSDQRENALANRDATSADIAEIEAQRAAVAVRRDKSTLKAPFAARVSAVHIEGGETVNPGTPAIRLVDIESPEFRVGLPLSIDVDAHPVARAIIDGVTTPARLRSTRPEIDARTRTRSAVYEIDTLPGLATGQSAVLSMTQHVDERGAWVPTSAIEASSGSLWQVLIVDDGIVRSAAIEILHAESDRVYVRGSFREGDQLIDRGPQRVTPGQHVRVAEGK
ncbi:MAG: efflux transporter periplasmic adaptor subunit [Gammaproteobacteria bacterium]|nr:MAG: efflux transporter periplasmic adaptor subunit [Gammaproteobacteria bacterium]